MPKHAVRQYHRSILSGIPHRTRPVNTRRGFGTAYAMSLHTSRIYPSLPTSPFPLSPSGNRHNTPLYHPGCSQGYRQQSHHTLRQGAPGMYGYRHIRRLRPSPVSFYYTSFCLIRLTIAYFRGINQPRKQDRIEVISSFASNHSFPIIRFQLTPGNYTHILILNRNTSQGGTES